MWEGPRGRGGAHPHCWWGGHLGCFLPELGSLRPPHGTLQVQATCCHLITPPVGEGHLVHHKPLQLRQVDLTQDKTILGWLDPVQGRRLFTFSPEGLADLGLPNSRGPGTSEQEAEDSMTLENVGAWRSCD